MDSLAGQLATFLDWLGVLPFARWLGDLPWGKFVLSPGFGGLAAVIAASIAYAGVRRTTQNQRETARKQQWWERARWALDLTLQDDPDARIVGLNVLDALASSEYAAEHELDLVVAATDNTLDQYEQETSDDDASGPGPTSEAHLEQDEDTSGGSV